VGKVNKYIIDKYIRWGGEGKGYEVNVHAYYESELIKNINGVQLEIVFRLINLRTIFMY
jgi:hypothetical protein